MVAGLCAGKILAPFCMREHINGEVFYVWLREHLIPELKPGQVVILDNINFHKYEVIKAELEEAGCRVKYLPKYSPDLNPIEKYWAFVKGKVRKMYKEETLFIEKLRRVLCLQYISILSSLTIATLLLFAALIAALCLIRSSYIRLLCLFQNTALLRRKAIFSPVLSLHTL